MLESILTSHCQRFCAFSQGLGLALLRPTHRIPWSNWNLERGLHASLYLHRIGQGRKFARVALKVDLPWGPSLGAHMQLRDHSWLLWLLCDFCSPKEPWLTVSTWPPGSEHTLLHLAHSCQAHHRPTLIQLSVSRIEISLWPTMLPDQFLFRAPIYKKLLRASVPHKTVLDLTQCQALVRHLVNIRWIKDRTDPAITPPAEGSYVLRGLIQSIVTALYLNMKTITWRSNQRRGNGMKYWYRHWLWKQIFTVQCPVLPPTSSMTLEKSRNQFFFLLYL